MRNTNNHTPLEWATFPLLSYAIRQGRKTKNPTYYDLEAVAMAMLRGPRDDRWNQTIEEAVGLFDEILADPASPDETQLVSNVRQEALASAKLRLAPLHVEIRNSKARLRHSSQIPMSRRLRDVAEPVFAE